MRRRVHPAGLGLTLVAALVTGAALAATAGGQPQGSAATRAPIVLGWAFDGQGAMAPFDGPALAAARIRINQVNARGGVRGRRLRLITCNTQNNDATRARTCAQQLLGRGAQIMVTTCDVDLATPVVQAGINRGKLTVAPCIGTDQMGPKRFGRSKGRLAFSFGNAAQDEGSAMAEFAWRRGWRRAALATDTVIVYFRNVVRAFDIRFRQLGGRIVARESYQSAPAGGTPNIQNAISRLSRTNAQVIVTSTAGAFGALGGLITGLRTLRNNTPILNSWAGDGNYWLPSNPRVTNYYYVTYASAFGNDPNPAVRSLVNAMRRAGAAPGTGGFLTGPALIDGVVTAIRRSKGSLRGVTLARQLERFRRVPTLSGRISFSRQLHSVFGRTYRVMRIHNNQVGYIGSVCAEVVGLIGPNGAGKSTLVNVLSGFDRPTRGTVELEGRDVTSWSAHRRGRAGLARTFQHSRSFRGLSVRENVEVAALGVGVGPRAARERANGLLERLGLDRYAELPASALAHGDERRLGVARALATEPRFVLMDEPAAGLPEAEVPDFAAVVRSVRDDHDAGVLLVDHNMALVMSVCDRVHVLDQGRTLAEGTPQEVRDNLDVAAAYLGETAVHEAEAEAEGDG